MEKQMADKVTVGKMADFPESIQKFDGYMKTFHEKVLTEGGDVSFNKERFDAWMAENPSVESDYKVALAAFKDLEPGGEDGKALMEVFSFAKALHGFGRLLDLGIILSAAGTKKAS